MHTQTVENWQHSHQFSVSNPKGEQRTKYVLILTAITMVAEIISGSIFGSMALLADGWQMAGRWLADGYPCRRFFNHYLCLPL